MSDAVIRPARPDDATVISQIARNAYQGYVAELGRPPAPMVADFAAHIVRDQVVVAERDGVIRGYAILITDARRALLDNIAVDPNAQRLGIGQALIDHVEHQALAEGFRCLELYTNIVMTENIDWYRKLGFRETRRLEEKGFHRIYMEKKLSDRTDGSPPS